MGTATLPPEVATFVPPANISALPLKPLGDVLYEVVDGQIVELPPMGAFESDIANFLARLIDEHASKGRLGRAFVELLFRIDIARNLKRRPDVAFVSAARWPYGKRVPRGEAWDMIPNLAVEVVSKTNTGEEILAKIAEYFRTGTELVWVVFPSVRLVYVYTSPTVVQVLDEMAVLDGGEVVPDFRLSVNQLFEDDPSAAEPDDVEIGQHL